MAGLAYAKSYRPDYVFPSRDTVSFSGISDGSGMSIMNLPPLPEDQVEVDNERARWPCFFPSSLGMITSTGPDGSIAAFPCGSTTIVSRHPLTVGICVSYARINARYAPRASLDIIRQSGRFGCGVPIYRRDVLDAISYLGNISLRDDPGKAHHCGLTVVRHGQSLGFEQLPIHFDCRVSGEIRLGTHAMILGEVEKIYVDEKLQDGAVLEWCPWAGRNSPVNV